MSEDTAGSLPTVLAEYGTLHVLYARYNVGLVTQVAQLSQRHRAAGWVSYGQKWNTGTGRQYLRTL